MLASHSLFIAAAFPEDIFAEAKKIVTRHYQWCLVHDFLPASKSAVDFTVLQHRSPGGSQRQYARPIDSVLANGLDAIPGGSRILAILATRDLRRGLALGLPGGQSAGSALGLTPLTARKAAVQNGGNQLHALGGGIVAETFVRTPDRDAHSFMNVVGFTPALPSSVPGTFTIAELLEFAGILVQ